jgi:uncharacterized DUF497 family protein
MFEFDAKKSKSNKQKHGIDFVEAQGLWEDECGFIEKAEFEKEERYTLTARLGNKI